MRAGATTLASARAPPSGGGGRPSQQLFFKRRKGYQICYLIWICCILVFAHPQAEPSAKPSPLSPLGTACGYELCVRSSSNSFPVPPLFSSTLRLILSDLVCLLWFGAAAAVPPTSGSVLADLLPPSRAHSSPLGAGAFLLHFADSALLCAPLLCRGSWPRRSLGGRGGRLPRLMPALAPRPCQRLFLRSAGSQLVLVGDA